MHKTHRYILILLFLTSCVIFHIIQIDITPFTLSCLGSRDDQCISRFTFSSWGNGGYGKASDGALSGRGVKKSFKGNLRRDRGYLYSTVRDGWNNQVIDILALIRVAQLSNRIPILNAFTSSPSLLGGDAPLLPISRIFNINALSHELGIPIVEVQELKTREVEMPIVTVDGDVEGFGHVGGMGGDEGEDEILGCWSYWEGVGENAREKYYEQSQIRFEHTPLPRVVFPWQDHSKRLSFPALVDHLNHSHSQFDHPSRAQQSWANDSLSILHNRPEDWVACVDHLSFGVEDGERYRWEEEIRAGLGIWRAVGRYLRFTDDQEELGVGYLRRLFGVGWGERVPDYMSVHIRRNDFDYSWKSLTQRHWAHAASGIMEEYKRKTGISIRNIVVTTDEKDMKWLRPLVDYGWKFVNHTVEGTVDKYDLWQPTIIDSVVLSGGIAFLGAEGSTMSMLSARRVIDWNEGTAGYITPDHEVPDDWVWNWDIA